MQEAGGKSGVARQGEAGQSGGGSTCCRGNLDPSLRMSDFPAKLSRMNLPPLTPVDPAQLLHARLRHRMTELRLDAEGLRLRLGSKDRAKARRHLDAFCDTLGERPAPAFRGRLAAALEVSPTVIDRWLAAAHAARYRAAWLAAFKPHGVIRTAQGGRPKSITIAALVGALRHRRIDFPPEMSPDDYLGHALETIRTRPELGFFFPAESVVLHYSPEHIMEHDLTGRLIRQREEPAYLGHLYASLA